MPAPDAVIQTVDEAMRLVAARGRTDLESRLRKTRDRLHDDRVRVLVIGEFKQGKSQLVNALVRARVCPVDDDIATSVPTAVFYSETPTVTLVKEEPGADPDDDARAIRVERTEASLEDLARYVSEMGNPANREGLSHVEVGLPTPLLQTGLELVDTPGVGGLGSVRATATLAALPGADAVLLVSDAAQEYTAAELEFLKHAMKLCPNIACVLTKIDLYPEWRRIYELNQEHLTKAGVTAQLIPVSSVLRWHALDRNDNELNIESGFPVLATMLSNTVGQAELLVRRAVANTVAGVSEQLARGLQSELGVQEHPETVQSTVADLRTAKERMTALRERGARWQQTLSDGVADLSADIDYDLRDRMRDIMRNAEDEIDVLGDPAVVWVEFAPWVEDQVAGATSANFVWANERARFLAAQVAEHFAEDGQLSLPDLDVGAGSSMQAVRPMYLSGDEEEPGLGAQALIAVRGGYIGTLMFGMFSTFAGLALLNPFSVGAGLLLGGRTLREEKKRLLQRRQAEAKNAVRRYTDDVIFHIGKDSRDMLRRVQRQLRDHFTEVATELETSLQDSLRTAEAGARTNAADREARIAELRKELATVAGLQQQARALVAVPREGGRHVILRRNKNKKDAAESADEEFEQDAAPRRSTAVTDTVGRTVPAQDTPVSAARALIAPASTDIVGQVRQVLVQAAEVYAQHPEAAERIRAHLDRLDSPVRIAIAGKVKAGKSTLLNALVGEVIAPTDAGECTRVVTWYRNSNAPRIVMRRKDGDVRDLPIVRQNGRLELDLAGTAPEDVDRLTVDWPSGDLATMTLIDTPGIASASAEVSARTEDFLTPDEEQGAADAIVYLMRHVHADDVGFLEAFHAHAAIGSSPVNTVAVLSRADEIGAGRADALQSSRAIASRLRADEKIRSLCQTVVPVAGLLAETGRTMRQAEFNALAKIAAADADFVDGMLLSADRFGRELPEGAPELPSATVRAALMQRFGLFGIRIALPLIRGGITDSSELAAELVKRSGLDDLREALTALFTERGDLLKARSALMALDSILRSTPLAESDFLLAQVERIFSGAHEFVELALLGSLRTGAVSLPTEQRAEAERLLGGTGQAQCVRLGLAPTATLQEIRDAATDAMTRWRRRAENPASTRPVADAARVIVRTCEGILASLA